MVDLKAFVETADALTQQYRPGKAMCVTVEIWNHRRGEYQIKFKVWDEDRFFEGPTPDDAIAMMRAYYGHGKTALAELAEVTLPETEPEVPEKVTT